MLDIVVRGGTVVTPSGSMVADIGIKDALIAAVAQPGTLPVEGAKIVNAEGRTVVPGGIDPHCHTAWAVPTAGDTGIVSGGPDQVSRAAIFGGTTTLVDFAFWRSAITLQDAVETKASDWQGRTFTDYALHPTFKDEVTLDVLEQIPEVIQAGHPSFKVWMTNTTPSRPRQKTDLGFILGILEKTSTAGGILAVHAEDDDLVMFEYQRLEREGRWSYENVHLAHNNLSEAISFQRIIGLAEHLEAAIYVVHVSASEGVDAISRARARGLPVYGEAVQQYLSFTYEDYQRPQGAMYHTYPSLKSEADRLALWSGLKHGTLSTVATDEMCTDLATKLRGKTIDDVTGGHAGVEVRMALMFTEAVAKGGMSLERYAEITATNAARILGLYPRKGVIAIGSDADIVVLDTFDPRPIQAELLHETDYSPFEGWEVQAWPLTTILRGAVVVEDGELVGKPSGTLVQRQISPEVLARPVC